MSGRPLPLLLQGFEDLAMQARDKGNFAVSSRFVSLDLVYDMDPECFVIG